MKRRVKNKGALGVLRVRLHGARGLESAAGQVMRWGRTEPFVVVSAGGQEATSSVATAGDAPEWNETLELHGRWGEFAADELTLYLLRGEDLLGQAEASLDGLRGSGVEQIHFDEELAPSGGALRFSVSWERAEEDGAAPPWGGSASEDGNLSSVDGDSVDGDWSSVASSSARGSVEGGRSPAARRGGTSAARGTMFGMYRKYDPRNPNMANPFDAP